MGSFLLPISLLLAAATGSTAGFFFTSLGGHIQGEREWQDFDVNNVDKYSYQNPAAYQQYVDYPQPYPQPLEKLRPTQTLIQATQHLLQPAQQLIQPPHQHIFPIAPQGFNEHDHVFPSPVQVLQPPYQLYNRFQNSQLAPQNSIPVVLSLVDNQSLLPVRAVYALPPFLEKLVQRVQGYYSVYNTPEQLTLDRPLFRPTESPEPGFTINTDITENNINENNPGITSPSSLETIPSVSSNTGSEMKPTVTSALRPIVSRIPDTTDSMKTTENTSKASSTLGSDEITPTTVGNEQQTTDSVEESSTEDQTEHTTDFITSSMKTESA